MGGKALDSVCSWLQESPTTALIRPVSLNDTICLQSCKMLFDSFRCDPYDFSEFPRRIVGMFLEDLDNPLLWSEGEPGAAFENVYRPLGAIPSIQSAMLMVSRIYSIR